MMMMVTRTVQPLVAAAVVCIITAVFQKHCWAVDVSIAINGAAATVDESHAKTDNDDLPKNPQFHRRRKTKNTSVPSVEIDCAIRNFAMEFASDKLPWASASQLRHVADALRLHECPTSVQSLEEEPKQRHAADTIDEGDAKTLPSAKILRGRRTEEFLDTKDNGTQRRQQQQKEAASDVEEESTSTLLYVDPNDGDDGAPGTLARPLKTIVAALSISRELRRSLASTTITNTTIVLRGGRHLLDQTLRLDSRDSHLTIEAYDGETPVLSGGDPLSLAMKPTEETPSVYSARLPPKPDGTPYNFTLLFLDRSNAYPPGSEADVRLVWAREPNGHPERDLQPDGYAAANGTDAPSWPDPDGAVHFVVGKNDGGARNSTVYPWHGEDLDPRGGGCHNSLHFGGTGLRFADGKGYWDGGVPRGLLFHPSSLNTTGWTPEGCAPAIAHVFHNAFWGNWQFEVESVNINTTNGNGNSNGGGDRGKLSFGRGGWQEGRGGGIGHQPFFVEGVREALDVPGEWWLDVPQQVLYYYPHGNETKTRSSTNHDKSSRSESRRDEEKTFDFVAPKLQRLIEVVGENSEDRTANGITLRDLTFAHTATTFLEPYEVPSPGDWSIHRGGALFVENARDASIEGCLFLRTGGNAVVLSGHTKRVGIRNNEFAWIGDSAIVTLGRIYMADGFTVDTYPEDTLIEANHFREIGIHGKQTSALFSALSCKTTFVGNVLYNGPRAGINLNDHFCHGHTIRDNLLFNWVRETQDHGPINTWDRAMYIQKEGSDNKASGNPTQIPLWTHMERNFILNGPSGNRDLGNLFPTIDNDDGSSYIYIAKNFLIYGGGKNYLGHDKVWTSNLFVYPGRWSGEPCAQIWGGKNHRFAENTCLIDKGDPPIGLDGSMEGFECKIDWEDPENNLEFVGMTAGNSYYLDRNDQWGFGCGNGTSPDHWFALEEMQEHGWELGSTVRDSKLLTADTIIGLAKKLLAMN